MRPGSDGWFNAIEVADQIGFASEDIGKICKVIQTTGSKNMRRNCFSNGAADAICVSGPLVTMAIIVAVASEITCCAKEPPVMAKIGAAAINAIKSRDAMNNRRTVRHGSGNGVQHCTSGTLIRGAWPRKRRHPRLGDCHYGPSS